MSTVNTLTGIMDIAGSGLQTSQTGLRVVSNNITNVNTPGYNAASVDQSSLQTGGVAVAQITTAVNTYLQQTSLGATAAASNYGAQSTQITQAQNAFGDPNSTSSFFSQLDSVFTAFTSLAATPTPAGQSQTVATASQFFNTASGVSQSLAALQSSADQQISSDVTNVNQLLQNINSLNSQISAQSIQGTDTTALQNQQSADITQLSQYIDIKVTQGSGNLTGTGVTVRASDGTPLTGQGVAPAVFSYSQTNGVNQLTYTPPGGVSQPYGSLLTGGELQGLLTARNSTIPNIAQQLAQVTASTAQALNTASNAHSAVPAPSSLTGQSLGVDIPTAISTFTGKTNIAIVNSAGVIQAQAAIDFGAGTISVGSPATVYNFTATAANSSPTSFVSVLNTALGASGSASVNGSTLSLSASGAGNGVVIADDPTTPSSSGGQSFSQYFGLNNFISSSQIPTYSTGLTASSASGYTSGAITFNLIQPNGVQTAKVNLSPTATTIGGLVNQLNSGVSGLGLYGTFSLNGQGVLSFTPKAGSNLTLGVGSDTTGWSANGTTTGVPLTQLFGLDPTVAALRAQKFSVNSAIAANPALIQNATVNLAATAGTAVIESGDTSGLDALSQAGNVVTTIPAAGGAAAATSSVSAYAANFSGQIGQAASTASTLSTTAQATATEASNRLSATDGVNLDNELINLTTYQQSYSASARLITAANAMYDTLLNMIP